MQSSRYCTHSNLIDAIEDCNKEADLYCKKFKEKNIPVDIIREKLETLASSTGVPFSDNEAKKYPKYFEFHIRVKRRNKDTITPVTPEEITELTTISEKFTKQFNIPVPISYNKVNEHQRYLNVRFRNVGSETARSKVTEIVNEINKLKTLSGIKQYQNTFPMIVLQILIRDGLISSLLLDHYI
jgi:hypothetical protein